MDQVEREKNKEAVHAIASFNPFYFSNIASKLAICMGIDMAKKEKRPQIVITPLEKANGHIKTAYVLAFISAGATLLLYLLSLAGFTLAGEQGIANLVMAVIVAGLGFGIIRKSRVCAVMLAVIFLLDKVLIIISDFANMASIIPSMIIWGTAYLAGVRGTFMYHKLKNEPTQDQNPLLQSPE